MFKKIFAFLLLIFVLSSVDITYGQDVIITTNTNWLEDDYSMSSLTVANGATLTIGGGSTVEVAGALTVTGNSTIILGGKNTAGQVGGQWQGTGVTINAGDLTIEAGSKISADGQGYVGGTGPGAGNTDSYSSIGSGGGYGGQGGPSPAGGAIGGAVYGSSMTPVDLGSGGGSAGGSGGGSIRITVSGMLAVNGTISANGAIGPSRGCGAGGGGGGAGGSILVTAGTLSGSGLFTANGGAGGIGGCTTSGDDGGGGGGGRIAVSYASEQSFGGFVTSSANGGGGVTTGQRGTVVFVNTTENHLRVAGQTLTFGEDSSISYSAMTLDSGAQVTIGGGSTVEIAGALTVTGSSTIILGGKNTAGQVGGQWQGTGVTINAGDLTIEAGSKISADGQGYAGNVGPGAGNADPYMSIGSGGGYGGQGGPSPPGGAIGGAVYGSSMMPTDLGSGGGNSGGSGGGSIDLNVMGTLTLNGLISANGAIGPSRGCGPSGGGGGAGGSILVTAGTLSGSGLFTANGGAGGIGGCTTSGDDGGGGGGGRIAVSYASEQSFGGFVPSSANGGGGGTTGQRGTVAFINTTNNHLRVAGQALTFGENSSIIFSAMTVDNGGLVTIGGGSTVDIVGTLTVTGNSTIILGGKNTTGQVEGRWQGTGVIIVAGNLAIEAGSKISADDQGYAGDVGPGAGIPDTYMAAGSGGGYGGQGGSSGAGAIGGAGYGSSATPTDSGSGGGHGGGNGGGSIDLNVMGTLTLNGLISANGAAGPGRGCGASGGGGGAGGSILVTAGTLSGSGLFTANGGAGGAGGCSGTGDDGGGGGGGRIAVYYLTNSGFNPASMTANGGGSGALAGAAGTVKLAKTYKKNDLSGDGKTDIIWRNLSNGRTTVWYLDGANWTGNYGDIFPTVSSSDWAIVGVADFNGDAQPDLLWRNATTGQTTVWYMDGATWTGGYADLPTVSGSEWAIVGVADFNKDGQPDLLWRNASTGRTTIWYMTGPTWNGGYADVEPTVADPNWSIVGIADFNRDHSPDLLWRDGTSGRMTIWYMDGPMWNGDYADVEPAVSDPTWQIVGIADFNNDGSPDLLWRNTTMYRTTVWYMNGPVWNGNWGDLLPVVSDPSWIVVGR